jgi:hypothetical protein
MHHNRNQSIIEAEKTQKKSNNKKTTHHQIHCHYHFGRQSSEKDIRNESLLNLLR